MSNVDYIAAVAKYGSGRQAAAALGIPRSTFNDHHRKQLICEPVVSSINEPVEDLIKSRVRNFERRYKHQQDKEWMPFTFHSMLPIAVPFVGDPHVDDNGCNWPLLQRDIQLIKDTEGVYPVGLGDYTNNWTGPLAQKISPHQSTTRDEGWQLAEYLVKAVDWLLLIGGNHDAWSKTHGTGDVLEWICSYGGRKYHDWQAKFRIVFPNGRELKIWAAHDFKGHSQWSNVFGPSKKAQMTGAVADIYVAGDKHCFGMHRQEVMGRLPWSARARGYKFIDSYSEQLGFASDNHGATVTAVIDPSNEDADSVMMFADLKQACAYLTVLRAMRIAEGVK